MERCVETAAPQQRREHAGIEAQRALHPGSPAEVHAPFARIFPATTTGAPNPSDAGMGLTREVAERGVKNNVS
jgi:hypothetical protein